MSTIELGVLDSALVVREGSDDVQAVLPKIAETERVESAGIIAILLVFLGSPDLVDIATQRFLAKIEH